MFRLVYPAGRRMTMVELQTWKSLLEVSKLLPNCANPRVVLFCKTFGCSSAQIACPNALSDDAGVGAEMVGGTPVTQSDEASGVVS